MTDRAVLISIQPKYCELIASGKKTVEVRKTKPNLATPFKCYIYCTKGNREYLQSRNNMFFYLENRDTIGGHGAGLYCRLNKHVIGEFVCDAVDRMAHCGTRNNDIRLKIVDKNLYCKELDSEYLNKCQLSYFDIDEYLNGGDGYGWHISNLVIYDYPKELSEFYLACNKPKGTDCSVCYERRENRCKSLKRPPQSWCYVEVLK